jgi:hypothetical protein
MTLAMGQEIDFLVMLRVFRGFISQPSLMDNFALLVIGDRTKSRKMTISGVAIFVGSTKQGSRIDRWHHLIRK